MDKKNMKYLTNNGNILIKDEFHAVFFSPFGEFLRECSIKEANYLASVCPEIQVLGFELPEDFIFPEWKFIASIQVIQDNSNYKWETACNGGNYSFGQYHDWYCTKYPNGEWKFGYIERHTTSADFAYDELLGNYSQQLGTMYVINAENNPGFQTQLNSWDEDTNRNWTEDAMFEKIGVISNFETLISETYMEIPSRFEDEETEPVVNQISKEAEKAILEKLFEITGEVFLTKLELDANKIASKGINRGASVRR